MGASVQAIEWNIQSGETRKIYPCRCGETHSGEYAEELWNHHNCYHTASPLFLSKPAGEGEMGLLMCMECGETFDFEVEK
ncbi:MAG TPA: hypothetical protein DCS05_07985 [Nitrospiraceae bacterium]|nr:hypothetical protein [Nitrospiraceae bacterium]